MRLISEELKGIYKRETARASWQRAECLSADDMMRMAEDRISQAERERATDHLMSCADCVEEYRLVRSLKPWAAMVAATVGDPQPQHAPESDASRFGWRERLAAFLSPARMSYAMAAALLVVSVALGVLAISLYRERQQLTALYVQQLAERDRRLAEMADALAKDRPIFQADHLEGPPDETQIAALRQKVDRLSATVDELSRPQLNVPIADLDPGNAARGEPAKALPTVEVPAGTNFFTLILHVSKRQTYSNYELEVLNQQGTVVWRGQGLQRSEAETFTITLPRRFFPAGRYRIKLYGLPVGSRDLMEDYEVSVRYL